MFLYQGTECWSRQEITPEQAKGSGGRFLAKKFAATAELIRHGWDYSVPAIQHLVLQSAAVTIPSE
jgi:hypothetical protein